MTTRSFTPALAILLTVTLIAPSVFLSAPQRVHAQVAVAVVKCVDPLTCVRQTVESVIQTITQKLTEINTFTTMVATEAMWWNASVLQPLAFVLSGNLMRTLTAGVIAFVIGKANGTGAPQFAVDVMGSLQTVSDSQALAYLNQFGRNSNSPFAYSIASSLRTNYLQKTSLAGFWAANMSTLARSSPNVNAFLAGNWSQGGVAAWFALTTQTQNNPYTLYQASQAQMSVLVGPGVGGVTGSRLAQLGWGQGFMSWCGAREGTTEDNDGTAMEETTTEDNDGTAMEGGGVNPGDPCTNKDGTPGTIKTPGSTIKATLDKVLGGQQDQIVRMGNVGPQINQILGNIATVLQTVNFAAQILGGPDSGGLFGVAQASGSNSTSRLMQYQATPSLGVTNADVYKNAATIGATGPDMSSRITQYRSAWNTIGAATNAASTSVATLVNFCTDATKTIGADSSLVSASQAQISAAQTALSTEVAPMLARVAAASTTIATATAMVQKVQSELNSGIDTTGSTYTADVQALQTMSPTARDVANAQQDAQVFGTAVASPAGSLNVSGGSLVDQMNLLSTNAASLKTVCTPGASVDPNQGLY